MRMDDLVDRLRRAKNMTTLRVGALCRMADEAADRIEELEARLKTSEEIGRSFEKDAGQLREKLAEMDAARDFPVNTCPASRHAQMIAEALIRGKPYPMLTEDPAHCGESIAAVVTALYEARSKLKQLEAKE